VCGTAVDTTAPKHVESYEGVDYYFCCDGCWTAFREAPAKFAAIHRAALVRARS
jgi:YHS domain-containing protein